MAEKKKRTVYVVLNTSQGCVAAVFYKQSDAATYVSNNSMFAFIISEHEVQ